MIRRIVSLLAVIALLLSSSGVVAKKYPWEDEKYRTKQYSYLYSSHTIYFDDVENLMHINDTLQGEYYTQLEWMSLYNAQMLYLNILKIDENLTSVEANINSINNAMVLNEVMVELGMDISSYNSNKDSLISLQDNLKTLKENRKTLVENLNVLLGYDDTDQLILNPITEITFDTSKILTLKQAQKRAGQNNFMMGNTELTNEAMLDLIDTKVETIHDSLLESLKSYENTKYAVNHGMDKRAVYTLQYELGMISKMNYESLIASLSSNLEKGNNKLREVYQYYVEYRAAINGYIPNLVTIKEVQQ